MPKVWHTGRMEKAKKDLIDSITHFEQVNLLLPGEVRERFSREKLETYSVGQLEVLQNILAEAFGYQHDLTSHILKRDPEILEKLPGLIQEIEVEDMHKKETKENEEEDLEPLLD